MGVAMDAGNMLKPALVRGEFRVIGATTGDEYIAWVCGDPALERRFQRVDVASSRPSTRSRSCTARVAAPGAPSRRRHLRMMRSTAAVRLTDEYVHGSRPAGPGDRRPGRGVRPHSAAPLSYRRDRRVVGGASSRARVAHRRRRGRPHRETPAPSWRATSRIRLERFARTGFDALERFGAEIEAAIAERLGDPAIRAALATRSRSSRRRPRRARRQRRRHARRPSRRPVRPSPNSTSRPATAGRRRSRGSRPRRRARGGGGHGTAMSSGTCREALAVPHWRASVEGIATEPRG